MARYYNRSTICRMFREMGRRPISKQTIHRLEIQGFFDPPPRKGGGNEERLFTKAHVQKLWEHWFGDTDLPEQLAS